MNTISNRFWYLNDKIKLEWLNDSFESYKIKMKTMFLSLKKLINITKYKIKKIVFQECLLFR